MCTSAQRKLFLARPQQQLITVLGIYDFTFYSFSFFNIYTEAIFLSKIFEHFKFQDLYSLKHLWYEKISLFNSKYFKDLLNQFISCIAMLKRIRFMNRVLIDSFQFSKGVYNLFSCNLVIIIKKCMFIEILFSSLPST